MVIGNYKEGAKKELNKWYFMFQYVESFEYFDKRLFRFGIFNFKKFPREGEAMNKEYYKGFIFLRQFRHSLTILKHYLELKDY